VDAAINFAPMYAAHLSFLVARFALHQMIAVFAMMR
jgi:hypothetical protein